MVAFVGCSRSTRLKLAFAAVYRALQAGGVEASTAATTMLAPSISAQPPRLAWTQIEATGPIRMVNMMQPLGGFWRLITGDVQLSVRTGLRGSV